MKLLVLGATGRTGRLLVHQAMQDGHHVTAMARHTDMLADTAHGNSSLTLHPGDVRDPDAVTAAAAGQHAAISVISTPARNPGRLYSQGTRNIVRALEDQQVRRFVCVSSGGVAWDDRGLPWWYRNIMIPLFMRPLYADMRDMEDTVRHSSLDWVLVRPAYLLDRPAQASYRIGDGKNPHGGWKLTRPDLAEFLLRQLGTDRWLHRAPTLAH